MRRSRVRYAASKDVASNVSTTRSTLVIDDSLLLQLLQKHADVRANLFRIRLVELLLQLRKDFPECALAIAALQHLASGILKFQCTLRVQDHAILLGSAPAASGGEARLARFCRRRHDHFSSI